AISTPTSPASLIERAPDCRYDARRRLHHRHRCRRCGLLLCFLLALFDALLQLLEFFLRCRLEQRRFEPLEVPPVLHREIGILLLLIFRDIFLPAGLLRALLCLLLIQLGIIERRIELRVREVGLVLLAIGPPPPRERDRQQNAGRHHRQYLVRPESTPS